MKRLLFTFFFLFVIFSNVRSLELSEDSKISLLTCSAGTEIYSYFGHSAIRIYDPLLNVDSVFNYGVFSFETPNFIWRFTKGETDYMLAVQSMQSFMNTYYAEKRDVYEQVLNFTREEKQILFDALMVNYLPQNRYYRYNHFLDNCATRIRDQFEKAAGGKLRYDSLRDEPKSFRDLLDEHLPDNSWSGFGIKLALGVPTDRITTFREKMFLPVYLQKDMSQAVMIREDERVPLLQPVQVLYKAPELKEGFSLTSPAVVVMLLLIFTLSLTIREYRIKRRYIWLDFTIYFIFGIAGIILGFLCFISELEGTGWNLNLFWAWPTHLIFAFLLLFPKLRKKLNWYPKLVTYALLIFLVSMVLLPQTFHWLVVPLCLTLLLRTEGIERIVKWYSGKKLSKA